MSFPLPALSSWKELRICICKRRPSWLAGWRSISRGHIEPTSILGQVTKERFTEQLSVRILVSSDNSVVLPPSPEDTLCSQNGDKETKHPAGSRGRFLPSLMVCSTGSLRRPPCPPPGLRQVIFAQGKHTHHELLLKGPWWRKSLMTTFTPESDIWVAEKKRRSV